MNQNINRLVDARAFNTRIFGLTLAVVLLLIPCYLFSASLYTETFFDSTGGWQDRDPGVGIGMTVTNVLAGGNPGGCMRGVFGSQAEPFPSQDSFIATGRLSSASFIGDYEEVDAWLLGFDFMATNIVPSGFTVLIYSGFNVISRTLTDTITTTGVWFSIKLPLLDAVSGSWGGDTHLFNNILTNVTRVEFRITRNLEGVQFYFMDNIFLDRLPDAVEVSPTNTVWLHMRSGAQYQFQASADLTQPVWTNLASFTATSSIYQVTFPATNDWRFYRMLMQ